MGALSMMYGIEASNAIQEALTRGGFASRYDAATRQIEVLDSASAETQAISALVQNGIYTGLRPVVQEERAANGNVHIRLEDVPHPVIHRIQLSDTYSLLSIPIPGLSLFVLLRTEDPVVAQTRRQFALLFAEMMKESKQELLSRAVFTADAIADMIGSSYDAMIEHSIFKMIAIATLSDTTLTFQKGERAVELQYSDALKKKMPAKIYDVLKVAYDNIRSLNPAQTEELKRVLDNASSDVNDAQVNDVQVKEARNAVVTAKGVINSNIMNTSNQEVPDVDWAAIFDKP